MDSLQENLQQIQDVRRRRRAPATVIGSFSGLHKTLGRQLRHRQAARRLPASGDAKLNFKALWLINRFIMKTYGSKVLTFERKPTISGDAQGPVGGEILPVNSLQLFFANFWWIFLLAVPILMYWLLSRYGMRIPPSLRQALRLIPLVARTAG
jgi:hypothetical protein